MTACASTPAPARAAEPEHSPAPPAPKPAWQKYGTPLLVVLLAAAVVFSITPNWNSWVGGGIGEDDDYKAQGAQATAAVEAGKAAIENNRRQRDLQDSKIERALAGIDQAKAQIVAAQAGIEAVQADVVRTGA